MWGILCEYVYLTEVLCKYSSVGIAIRNADLSSAFEHDAYNAEYRRVMVPLFLNFSVSRSFFLLECNTITIFNGCFYSSILCNPVTTFLRPQNSWEDSIYFFPTKINHQNHIYSRWAHAHAMYAVMKKIRNRNIKQDCGMYPPSYWEQHWLRMLTPMSKS